MDYWSLIEGSIHIITAVSTLVMALATYCIARVSARTLKAGTTPQVIAHLQDHFHDIMVPMVTVAVENIGHGTAQNVLYHLHIEDEAGQDLAKKRFLANKQDIKIDFLPTGVKREMILGATHELYDPDKDVPVMAPFKVTIQYENMGGKKFGPQTFTLDLNNFEGRGAMAKSSIVDIEKSLRSLPKIERLIERKIV